MPNSNKKIYEQIEQSADFYQPAVYAALSFYHALENQQDPLDGQFIPLTTVQPWEQARTVLFAVGLLPPTSNVTQKLLDRSASVRAIEGSYEALLAQYPDVGSSSTGDLPGESGGIATSTPIPVGPKELPKGLEENFWNQYVVMCNRLGCQPEELAMVIQKESGFNPAIPGKNKDGKVVAKGLNQMLRETATNAKVGMTSEEYDNFENLSGTEQLKYVERYYSKRVKGKTATQINALTFGGYNNPDGSLYSSTASPPAYKNAGHQQRAYADNKGLDKPPPPKGYITPADLARTLKPLQKRFAAAINKARSTMGMSTDYNPIMPDASSAKKWPENGSENANSATKTISQNANKNLNQTQIGTKFAAQQKIMINQTIAALTTIANTPPLRLLVNPQSFKCSSEKVISDGNWGRNGPIIEHWGDNQDKIEASGKIAAFFSLDANEGNGPGLTRTARQYSAAYQNLLSLWLLYKNNGGVWFDDPLVPAGSKAKNLSVVGSVYIYYDNTLYIGSFDNFTITETETAPFSLEYSFSFTVRATFLMDRADDPRYTYGRPTIGTTTTRQVLPISTSTTSPLSGGNSPQPSPQVAPPPSGLGDLNNPDILIGI